MKLKKFFAGVLAAAMMLTVGATAAFATGPSDGATTATATKTEIKYNEALTKDSQIPLYKTYEVKGGTTPAETFKFQVKYLQVIRQDDAATEPYTTETVINLTGKETAFDPMTAGSDSKSFNITPAELGLGNPTGTGKYLYEISEIAGNTAATKYADPVYMAVTVAHKVNDKDEIQTGYEYYVTMFSSKEAALSAKNSSVVEGKTNNTKAFTNTYGDGNIFNLRLEKDVKGSFGDLGEKFTFYVTFTGEKDKAYSDIQYTKSTSEISVVDMNNEAAATLKCGTQYKVTLKDGWYIDFTNIPTGVTYTIAEDTTKEGWQYDVSLAESTVTFAKATATATGTVNANGSVTFINDHQGTPDMGVVLDNAPYIAMLAIVAIGGVALMLNKRRRDEE